VDEILRVGNASGFYGDRHAAMREMVEDGPLDVLTGDYLAELTMLILWRSRQKDPSTGYAKSFLRQLREVIAPIAQRRIKVVANAGGLNPTGLAAAVRELVTELGLDLRVAAVTGDDLMPSIEERGAAELGLVHLDTGIGLEATGLAPLTANAYLGGWGIAAALAEGADIVVTGRVTDASLTVGPAAWRFGWMRDDHDALAGAVVAGHVIECGAQATGGNYAFFQEVDDLTHPGFPIAEVHPDGSSIITKHPGTGGRVDTGTVTAQLLYEIGGPRYLNADVTARMDTISLAGDGPDRVRISGVRGEPPPPTTKVSVTTLGGFRNRATFVLTGLDIPEKAELARRQLAHAIDLDGLDHVEWRLVRSDHPDAEDNAEATASLTVTVQHHDPTPIGRRGFAAACVELALASYPGFTLTAPPEDAEPFGRYWPGRIPATALRERVILDDAGDHVSDETGRGDATLEIEQSGVRYGAPPDERPSVDAHQDLATLPHGPTIRAPLGRLAGARSGDKGGDANVGLWVRDPAQLGWLLATVGTPDRVRELLPEASHLDVEVHPLPNLSAVNIVVRGLLGDGVASSTRPDPQAKGLGEYLRSRRVDVPAAWLDRSSDS